MRVLQGILAGAAAGALALGAAAPALAERELGLSFQRDMLRPGEEAQFTVEGCKADAVAVSSKALEKVTLESGGRPRLVTGTATVKSGFQAHQATISLTCGNETAKVTKTVDQPLKTKVVDGKLGENGSFAAKVTGCESGDLSWTSDATSKFEWDDETNVLKIWLKKDLQPGKTYTGTIECGNETLPVKGKVTEDMIPGEGNDDGGNQDDGKNDDGGDNGGDNTGDGDNNADDGGKNDGKDNGDKSPEPEPKPQKLSFLVTDGFFTAADRGVALKILHCRSNDVTASSPAFASTSYDKKSHILNAQIKQGIENGTYKLRITCEGQKPLTTKIGINQSPMDESNDHNGDDTPGGSDNTTEGNDQTSHIPEGAAQTGGGATASTRLAS